MRSSILLGTFLLGCMLATGAAAQPTAEEISQLGDTLTPLGAIKAGNAEGTIPAWESGVCSPPAGYRPARGNEGPPYVDPFADDKPRLRIDAGNWQQHADKLDDGVKEFFRRHPDTFYMDVYPTRRSACFEDWVYRNTIERAMNPRIVNDLGVEGAHAQVPFPIPKTGVEAMWNVLLAPDVAYSHFPTDAWLVDAAGRVTRTALQAIDSAKPYWDDSLSEVPADDPFWTLIARTIDPAAQMGTMQMRHQFLRADMKTPLAWTYLPGQRRVRLAPEFSYDGVTTTTGGLLLYDEINGFDGKMDRYDFKLVGRQEMYVPYNMYTHEQAPIEDLHRPNHVNPEMIRWELHRVWVVDATLKPGERHVQQRKLFYIDEDSWNMLLFVGYDHSGAPHHYIQFRGIQEYERPIFYAKSMDVYDFNKRSYLIMNRSISPGLSGREARESYPGSFFTPGALAGRGVR